MLPYMWASQEKCFGTVAAVMTNADTAFTISGGPIQIISLLSECITANGATASTLQWQSAPTVGSAKTISGASASLASATAGSTVRLNQTALSTAPDIITAANGGVQLGTNIANQMIVMPGTLKLVIGVGTTTGTWKHHLRYMPMNPDAIINGN
ncbi:MAG: hypothetical protein ITD33_01875 [Nitrosarchaeum sp.]|nr:hypothetical protein [Nitrosarchaeum sp.]